MRAQRYLPRMREKSSPSKLGTTRGATSVRCPVRSRRRLLQAQDDDVLIRHSETNAIGLDRYLSFPMNVDRAAVGGGNPDCRRDVFRLVVNHY